ncbi:MAG: ABC transporter ATP-binding protein [Rhodobacteraceae bacterium]|nr:ABC transporter ATP-binding protein [Paracoccaceae bacterium]
MTARIDISAVTRRYGATLALAGVDLTVEAGAYCVLLGPSGCGKSTLLNILGGFADPTSGAVRIGGRDMVGVPAAARPTTTVFQDYALFPHMTLLDNVGFGLRMRGMARRARQSRAAEMLALVGLDGAGARRPADLSGGQRQRVALARALAVEPDVLLLDEPLGALDLNLRRVMQDELKRIQRSVGATFVHVTHDQEEAMAIADRLVVMNAGRIEDQGPPERVYRAPASRFAAGFLGEMSFLPARVQAGRAVTALGVLGGPQTHPEGTRMIACIRPEHLRIGPGPALGPIDVLDTVFMGAHRKVRLRARAAPDVDLTALLPADTAPGPDLAIDAGAVTLLPDNGDTT